ncbi:MAG: hypothetical protein JKY96_01150 [Phycisphaerales bacterium]|nr:hypothetical protein [Phycisphaerales bacterium]
MPITTRKILSCAALTMVVVLGGCSTSTRSAGAWAWSPPPVYQPQIAARVNPANAVVQPNYGFRVVQASEYAPEYSRRDEQLGVHYGNPYESWMGWPVESRPTLDQQGSYYTSRNANQYRYPRVRREYRRTHRSGYQRRHVR